jgi:hypothetical protein
VTAMGVRDARQGLRAGLWILLLLTVMALCMRPLGSSWADVVLVWTLAVVVQAATGLVAYKYRPDWAEVVARAIVGRRLALLVAVLRAAPSLVGRLGLDDRQVAELATLSAGQITQVQLSFERNLLVRRGLPPLVNTIVKVLLFVLGAWLGAVLPDLVKRLGGA